MTDQQALKDHPLPATGGDLPGSGLAVTHRSVEALIPYARNARTHSQDQIDQIAASITEFGWTNPVLVDGGNGIIAGHGRVLAAQKLGLADVPCIELSHLSEAQKRAYVLADNRLAENAGWDKELLALELADLSAMGADLSLIGFTEDELAGYLDVEDRKGQTDDDAAPELPAAPVSQTGDLWQLGDHRLICGDSTDESVVAALMEGQKADLIFTDPPYGMAYGGGRAAGSTEKGARVKAHGMIRNDELVGDHLVSLVGAALREARKHACPETAVYVCGTWRTYGEFADAMNEAGCEVKAVIVWDKGSIGLGNAHYRPQHEFLFYHPGRWYGGKAEGDVWSLSRDAVTSYVHPTQKPVDLIARALRNSSRPDNIVLDSFGGSGATLIAAAKTGRSARLMELDPKYCDVIIHRWQDWSGEDAYLAEKGAAYEEISRERGGA